ncbi:phage GP46 family protein [Adonisia turfae]
MLRWLLEEGGWDLDVSPIQTLEPESAVGLASVPDSATLESEVVTSLFTDRRAAADDRLPDPAGEASLERRGWWADALHEVAGHLTGSKLWLLVRRKADEETRLLAELYAREALQHLIDQGAAAAVEVTAAWSLPPRAPGRLALEVAVVRPDGSRVTAGFDLAWTA